MIFPSAAVYDFGVRLADLVRTSLEVTATRSRGRKIELLAAALRRADDDIEIAVAFLAGNLRQARVGIGAAATIRALALEASAAEPVLTLSEADAAFAALAATGGRDHPPCASTPCALFRAGNAGPAAVPGASRPR